MTRSAVAALAAALLLDACSPERGGSAAGESEAAASASAESPAALPTAIPPAMRGRWGLVAADCTGPASEAKGLMTVGADQLEFYESRGRLGKVSSGDDTHIRATYAFTGEGMNWTREELLELSDDGRTLMRQEFGAKAGDDPGPGVLSYHLCH